jgi:hypothetical protein
MLKQLQFLAAPAVLSLIFTVSPLAPAGIQVLNTINFPIGQGPLRKVNP